jgi:transposase-like protein
MFCNRGIFFCKISSIIGTRRVGKLSSAAIYRRPVGALRLFFVGKKDKVEQKRISESFNSIQVNFCKNPKCSNFGIPALENIKSIKLPAKTKENEGKRSRDNYTVTGDKRIRCHKCGAEFPMKSNKGIYEEYSRLCEYLTPEPVTEKACRNEDCANYGTPVSKGTQHYYRDGKQKSLAQRYKCRKCGCIVTVNLDSAARQKKREVNTLIFKLLVNKMPLQRICEVAEISMPTLYSKIDFIYKKCRAFAGVQENRLIELRLNRLQISVDRQEYMLNWTDTIDKRNVVVYALGSSDNRSSFVFGMHLNIDTEANRTDIEAAAEDCGDYENRPPLRKFARFWLPLDFAEASVRVKARKKTAKAPNKTLQEDLEESYEETALREDVESFEEINDTIQPSNNGVQIHGEYTMYGHFLFLKKLLPNAGKIRFYMEKESGIRSACLAAFTEEVRQKKCDAFYVKINKEMTIKQKNVAMAKGRAELRSYRESGGSFKDLSDNSLRALMLEQAILSNDFFYSGHYRDKWFWYPAPLKNEPEKAVSWLTDTGDNSYARFHLSKLMLRASLFGIDRFFMQVRRRISLLERPMSSSSATGQRWYGYSPYKPEHAVKLLEIFRVFHNYVHATTDAKRRILKEGEVQRRPGEVSHNYLTPAMRLGLMDRQVSIDEVLS